MKRLIIVRHGNTFRPGETPTRVGSATDLPLVEEERARFAGKFIAAHYPAPDRILAAPLLRTRSTAELLCQELATPPIVELDNRFVEIHYGPDENKTEHDVEHRLGLLALKQQGLLADTTADAEILAAGAMVIEKWNTHATLPAGWQADIPAICTAWHELAESIKEGETVVVVSSNGTIRFAPVITGNYSKFCEQFDLKVATGSVSVFEQESNQPWHCSVWNERIRKAK